MTDVTSVYGPLVAATDVEDALLAVLQTWISSYLNETERRTGQPVGTYPRPRAYVRSAEVEKFPEDQLPVVMFASPGLTEPPLADGDGNYTARWRVLLAAEVAARGNRLALAIARRYAAALRLLAVQQPDLPGLAVRRIDWMDERYDVLSSVDDRTVCVAQVELAVEVWAVANRNTGPTQPEPDPGPDESATWPIAREVDAHVLKADDA